ncbi:MAG: hydroxymethylbilane synthase [Thermomicrobiales bacterium]
MNLDRITTSPLLIGTRGSALALWQANAVRRWLLDRDESQNIELSVITSDGDRDKQSSLTVIGGRGVFTSALQGALLRGEIDMAVHSAKDLPGITPRGLDIVAFPAREISLDALVSRHHVGLRDLPPYPVIGTSSRRRAVQILAIRPDARIADLRGNIDTRLRKARTDAYDAIVLAAAGLARMGWEREITAVLPIESFTPAPGQGVLAIEARIAPDAGWSVARGLDDPEVRMAVSIERAFLRGVGGGCTTPIGAHAAIVGVGEGQRIDFHAMLADDAGDRLERTREQFSLENASQEVFVLAQRMLQSVKPSWAGVSFGSKESGRTSPLNGVRVMVTGTPEMVDTQMSKLRSAGADPFFFPTVRIEPAPDASALEQAIAGATEGAYDWMMVTSANAVSAIAAYLRPDRTITAQIAAVGERTADALSNIGVRATLVPGDQSARGMLAAFASESLVGKRVLLPLSSIARPTLADGLRERGAIVEVVTAYQTVPVTEIDAGAIASLTKRVTNAVVLSSPSAVASLVDLLGAHVAAISGALFIAIGDTTANAMRVANLPVHSVAAEPTPDGIVNALLSCYGGTASVDQQADERNRS